MKIKPEHVEYMRAAITAAATTAPDLQAYLARGLTEKRWRWDLSCRAGLTPWICRTIYPYANDEHIDTALRHIAEQMARARQEKLAELNDYLKAQT